MRRVPDISDHLLDTDGTCRDVIFDSSSWEGVKRTTAFLSRDFAAVEASDTDGNVGDGPVDAFDLSAATRGGSVSIVYRGGRALFRHLLMCIGGNEDGSPSVEITFFPADLQSVDDLSGAFLSWAATMLSLLEARRYFAKHEGENWTFGDTGPQSGVFLVSDDLGDDAR